MDFIKWIAFAIIAISIFGVTLAEEKEEPKEIEYKVFHLKKDCEQLLKIDNPIAKEEKYNELKKKYVGNIVTDYFYVQYFDMRNRLKDKTLIRVDLCSVKNRSDSYRKKQTLIDLYGELEKDKAKKLKIGSKTKVKQYISNINFDKKVVKVYTTFKKKEEKGKTK